MEQYYCKPYDVRIDDELPDGSRHVNMRFWGLDRDSNPMLVRVEDFCCLAHIELPVFINNKKFSWNEYTSHKLYEWICKILKQDAPVIYSLVKKKKLYYYDTAKPFLAVVFNSINALNHCKNLFKKPRDTYDEDFGILHLHVWEADISSVRKYFTLKNQKYTQWFGFKSTKIEPDDPRRISKPGRPDRPRSEFLVSWKDIEPVDPELTKNWTAFPKKLSYDIECNSNNHNKFPNEYNPLDSTFLITLCTDFEPDPSHKKATAILFGQTNPVESVDRLIEVDDEYSLLEWFDKCIDEEDPDVLIGYNTFGFDNKYLHARNSIYAREFDNFSCLKNGTVKVDSKKWKSSGYGYNIVTLLDVEGRIQVDMFTIIKRDYKFPMYKLDYTANFFLGEQKHDVSPKDMFRAFAKNQKGIRLAKKKPDNQTLKSSKKAMAKVIGYGIQDSWLPLKLFDKLKTWISLIELSSIVGVTVTELFTRGQQVRGYSLIYDLCAKTGFVVTKRDYPIIPYAGAFVVPPKQGKHKNVLCLDFKSLYPSIIMANNIDFSTIRKPGQEFKDPDKSFIVTVNQEDIDMKVTNNLEENDFGQVDDDFREDQDDEDDELIFEKDDNPEEELSLLGIDKDDEPLDPKKKYTKYTFSFVKPEVRKGIIPTLMRSLVDERNNVRKELTAYEEIMERVNKSDDLSLEELKLEFQALSEKSPSNKVYQIANKILNQTECLDKLQVSLWRLRMVVLDKQQLGLKLTANSLYGFMGAQTNGILPFIEGAMVVTFLGKRYIRRCIRYLIETYDAVIIYGDTDSVMFIIFGVDRYNICEWGQKLAKELSKLFPPPLELDFEKGMIMISFTKKRYAAYLINEDGSYKMDKKTGLPYLFVRGITIARRDNCAWLRDSYTDILRNILDDNDILSSYKLVVDSVLQLLYNIVDPVKELSVIKTLNADYKNNCPMKIFGDRLREMGKPIAPGERLEYIVLEHPNDNKPDKPKLGEKMILVEDYNPEIHKIDMVYYIEKIFKNNIDQLFKVGHAKELEKYGSLGYSPEYCSKQPKTIEDPIKMISLILVDMMRGKVDFKYIREFIETLPSELEKYIQQQGD